MKSLAILLRGPLKSPAEISEDLYLTEGDSDAKLSRFWLLLTLSGIIAAAGVLANSTATVIGAMIIAPLATPIQAIGYSVITGALEMLRKALQILIVGSIAVVLIGVALTILLPEIVPIDNNDQIMGRVSPTLVDLIAAIATGFAGSIGIARRDISDILPGVAIAISLVPPLAVVGITVAYGEWGHAFGALTLFSANVLAIILTGILVFIAIRIRPAVIAENDRLRRRAYITIGAAMAVVTLALGASTYRTSQLLVWDSRATEAVEEWAKTSELRVIRVEMQSSELIVVLGGGIRQPDTKGLLNALRGAVPAGTSVDLEWIAGASRTIGKVPKTPPSNRTSRIP